MLNSPSSIWFVVPLLALFACKGGAESGPKEEQTTVASEGVHEGDEAPDLEFEIQTGERQRLSALRGKYVVLYFYPQDQTRGCTVQAQGIRDSFAEFTQVGAVVIGVSTQDAASHTAFVQAEGLPFNLAVDTEGAIARAFGVSVSGGRAARDTVLVDPKGVVRKIWRGVSPKEHAGMVLAAIKAG